MADELITLATRMIKGARRITHEDARVPAESRFHFDDGQDLELQPDEARLFEYDFENCRWVLAKR